MESSWQISYKPGLPGTHSRVTWPVHVVRMVFREKNMLFQFTLRRYVDTTFKSYPSAKTLQCMLSAQKCLGRLLSSIDYVVDGIIQKQTSLRIRTVNDLNSSRRRRDTARTCYFEGVVTEPTLNMSLVPFNSLHPRSADAALANLKTVFTAIN